MQTMDMIVVKKKRIALIERDAGTRNNSRLTKENPSGVWSMLRSVTSVRSSSSESKFTLPFFSFFFFFFSFFCKLVDLIFCK